jgi:hypothetical protein
MGRRAGWSVRAATGGIITELDRPPDREELEVEGDAAGTGGGAGAGRPILLDQPPQPILRRHI